MKMVFVPIVDFVSKTDSKHSNSCSAGQHLYSQVLFTAIRFIKQIYLLGKGNPKTIFQLNTSDSILAALIHSHQNCWNKTNCNKISNTKKTIKGNNDSVEVKNRSCGLFCYCEMIDDILFDSLFHIHYHCTSLYTLLREPIEHILDDGNNGGNTHYKKNQKRQKKRNIQTKNTKEHRDNEQKHHTSEKETSTIAEEAIQIVDPNQVRNKDERMRDPKDDDVEEISGKEVNEGDHHHSKVATTSNTTAVKSNKCTNIMESNSTNVNQTHTIDDNVDTNNTNTINKNKTSTNKLKQQRAAFHTTYQLDLLTRVEDMFCITSSTATTTTKATTTNTVPPPPSISSVQDGATMVPILFRGFIIKSIEWDHMGRPSLGSMDHQIGNGTTPINKKGAQQQHQQQHQPKDDIAFAQFELFTRWTRPMVQALVQLGSMSMLHRKEGVSPDGNNIRTDCRVVGNDTGDWRHHHPQSLIYDTIHSILQSIQVMLQLLVQYKVYTPSQHRTHQHQHKFLHEVTKNVLHFLKMMVSSSTAGSHKKTKVDHDDHPTKNQQQKTTLLITIYVTIIQSLIQLNHTLLHGRWNKTICLLLQIVDVNTIPLVGNLLVELVETYRLLRQPRHIVETILDIVVNITTATTTTSVIPSDLEEDEEEKNAAKDNHHDDDVVDDDSYRLSNNSNPRHLDLLVNVLGTNRALQNKFAFSIQTTSIVQVREIVNVLGGYMTKYCCPPYTVSSSSSSRKDHPDDNDHQMNHQHHRRQACFDVVTILSVVVFRNVRVDASTVLEIQAMCHDFMTNQLSFLIPKNHKTILERTTTTTTSTIASSLTQHEMMMQMSITLCGWLLDLHSRCLFWVGRKEEMDIPKPIRDILNESVSITIINQTITNHTTIQQATPNNTKSSSWYTFRCGGLQLIAYHRLRQLHSSHNNNMIHFWNNSNADDQQQQQHDPKKMKKDDDGSGSTNHTSSSSSSLHVEACALANFISMESFVKPINDGDDGGCGGNGLGAATTTFIRTNNNNNTNNNILCSNPFVVGAQCFSLWSLYANEGNVVQFLLQMVDIFVRTNSNNNNTDTNHHTNNDTTISNFRRNDVVNYPVHNNDDEMLECVNCMWNDRTFWDHPKVIQYLPMVCFTYSLEQLFEVVVELVRPLDQPSSYRTCNTKKNADEVTQQNNLFRTPLLLLIHNHTTQNNPIDCTNTIKPWKRLTCTELSTMIGTTTNIFTLVDDNLMDENNIIADETKQRIHDDNIQQRICYVSKSIQLLNSFPNILQSSNDESNRIDIVYVAFQLDHICRSLLLHAVQQQPQQKYQPTASSWMMESFLSILTTVRFFIGSVIESLPVTVTEQIFHNGSDCVGNIITSSCEIYNSTFIIATTVTNNKQTKNEEVKGSAAPQDFLQATAGIIQRIVQKSYTIMVQGSVGVVQLLLSSSSSSNECTTTKTTTTTHMNKRNNETAMTHFCTAILSGITTPQQNDSTTTYYYDQPAILDLLDLLWNRANQVLDTYFDTWLLSQQQVPRTNNDDVVRSTYEGMRLFGKLIRVEHTAAPTKGSTRTVDRMIMVQHIQQRCVEILSSLTTTPPYLQPRLPQLLLDGIYYLLAAIVRTNQASDDLKCFLIHSYNNNVPSSSPLLDGNEKEHHQNTSTNNTMYLFNSMIVSIVTQLCDKEKYHNALDRMFQQIQSHWNLHGSTTTIRHLQKPTNDGGALSSKNNQKNQPLKMVHTMLQRLLLIVQHSHHPDQIQILQEQFSNNMTFHRFCWLKLFQNNNNHNMTSNSSHNNIQWAYTVQTVCYIYEELFRRRELFVPSVRHLALLLSYMNQVIASCTCAATITSTTTKGQEQQQHNDDDVAAAVDIVFTSFTNVLLTLFYRYPKQLLTIVSSVISLFHTMFHHILRIDRNISTTTRITNKSSITCRSKCVIQLCEQLVVNKDVYKKYTVGLVLQFVREGLEVAAVVAETTDSVDSSSNNSNRNTNNHSSFFVRDSLIPAIYLLLDTMSSYEREQLNVCIGTNTKGKVLFQSIYTNYEKYHVYKGQ